MKDLETYLCDGVVADDLDATKVVFVKEEWIDEDVIALESEFISSTSVLLYSEEQGSAHDRGAY